MSHLVSGDVIAYLLQLYMVLFGLSREALRKWTPLPIPESHISKIKSHPWWPSKLSSKVSRKIRWRKRPNPIRPLLNNKLKRNKPKNSPGIKPPLKKRKPKNNNPNSHNNPRLQCPLWTRLNWSKKGLNFKREWHTLLKSTDLTAWKKLLPSKTTGSKILPVKYKKLLTLMSKDSTKE